MKRTTTKLYGVLLTVLAALVLTGSASVTTQAKTKKPYKTKTLKLVEGKKKTWYAGRRIKKVKKISKNKNFTVKIIDCRYSLRFTGTDRNTKQTVKVYYKNGRTQKFNLKTDVNYLNKIKADLKPMLADPDKGLRTAISQWETKLEKKTNRKYTFTVFRDNINADGNTIGNDPDDYTIDEAIQKMTTSQKKAMVLEAYLTARMTYNTANKGDYSYHRKTNSQYAKLYKGTFKGVCSDGARMTYDIAKSVGLTARLIESGEMDHEWCVVKITDTNGKTYWQGVHATSYTLNMKFNYSKTKGNETYTKKDINKWLYTPSSIYLHYSPTKNRIVPSPTTPTTPSAVTASAIKCPGCTGNIQHNAKNPYKTNKPFSYGNYGVWMYIHNGGGVIRLYDENGNEYPEVVELAKDILKNYL